MHNGSIHPLKTARNLLFRIPRRQCARRAGLFHTQPVIFDESDRFTRERFSVVGRQEHAIPPVFYDLREAQRADGKNGQAAGHRLEDRKRHVLAFARRYEDIARLQYLDESLAEHESQKSYAPAKAECADKLFQGGAPGSVADDEELCIRNIARDESERANGLVDALLVAYPPHIDERRSGEAKRAF